MLVLARRPSFSLWRGDWKKIALGSVGMVESQKLIFGCKLWLLLFAFFWLFAHAVEKFAMTLECRR